MNKDSLQYADTHMAWQQRVRKELESKQYFVSKNYVAPQPGASLFNSFDAGESSGIAMLENQIMNQTLNSTIRQDPSKQQFAFNSFQNFKRQMNEKKGTSTDKQARRNIVLKQPTFANVKIQPTNTQYVAKKLNKRAKSSVGPRPKPVYSQGEIICENGSTMKPKKQLYKQLAFSKQSSLAHTGTLTENDAGRYFTADKDQQVHSPGKFQSCFGGQTTFVSTLPPGQTHVPIAKDAWLGQSTGFNSQLMSSYPVPFKRVNQDLKFVRGHVGYLNDGTAINPSDPNSMVDQGATRNTPYNVAFEGVPDVHEEQYSKALGVNDPGLLNNTFYSFGANYTNVRDHLQAKPHSQQNTSMGKYDQIHGQVSYLNKKFKDIKMRTKLLSHKMQRSVGGSPRLLTCGSAEIINTINKEPNAVMNDYTKNISQSIFTPGVYQSPAKVVRIHELFQKKRGTQLQTHSLNKRGSCVKFGYDGRVNEDVTGYEGKVKGKLGEKQFKLKSSSNTNSHAHLKSLDSQRGSARGAFRGRRDGHDPSTLAHPGHKRNQTMKVTLGEEGDYGSPERMKPKRIAHLNRTYQARKNDVGGKETAKFLNHEIRQEKHQRRKLEKEVENLKSTIYQLSDYLRKSGNV